MLRLFTHINTRNKFLQGCSGAFIGTNALGGFAVNRLHTMGRAAADLRDNAFYG